MKNTWIIFPLVFFSFFTSISFLDYRVFAQTASTVVGAQVKISVCGNTIIEGGEDCESLDLNSKTCQNFGYFNGNLSCDIACSFDIGLCTDPIPTPTPTSIPTPEPTSAPNPEQTSSQDNSQSSSFENNSSSSNSSLEVLSLLAPTLAPIRVLPKPLQTFDTRGHGFLKIEDLSTVVKMWVDEWKKYLSLTIFNNKAQAKTLRTPTCDLNSDEECDLIDFSILIHYIEG